MKVKQLPTILLGTKSDLVDPIDTTRFMSDEFFTQFPVIAHKAISSKLGYGLDDALHMIIDNIHKSHQSKGI